jgi:hypothetical protein
MDLNVREPKGADDGTFATLIDSKVKEEFAMWMPPLF